MNSSIEKEIGQNIRRLREKAKITQETLSAKLQLHGCDITRSALAKIEVGQRYLYVDEIMLIKKILRVSYDGNIQSRPTPAKKGISQILLPFFCILELQFYLKSRKVHPTGWTSSIEAPSPAKYRRNKPAFYELVCHCAYAVSLMDCRSRSNRAENNCADFYLQKIYGQRKQK